MADAKISALPAVTTPLAGTEVLPVVQSSTTKKVSVANLTAGRAVSAASLSTTGDVTVSGYMRLNNYVSDVNDFAIYIVNGPGTTIASQSGIAFRTANVQRLAISSGGDITANTGNLVIGTAGKGIDFSANGGDILGQYDEGIFVTGLTATTSGTVTLDYDKLNYTRIGRTVTLTGEVRVLSVSSPTGTIQLTLPFTSAITTSGRSGRSSLTLGLFFAFDGAPTGSLIGIIEANTNKMTLVTYDNFVQTDITSYLKVGTAMRLCLTYLCQ